MAFLFKHKVRSPVEQVKQIGDDLAEVGVPRWNKHADNKADPKRGPVREQSLARAAKHIGQLRRMVEGMPLNQSADTPKGASEREGGASTSQQAADLAIVEMCKNGLIHQLCATLSILDMDSCKDITACVNAAIHSTIDGDRPGVEYLLENQHIFDILSAGYKSDSTALHCGAIIQESARHPELARVMLLDPGTTLFEMFTHVESPMFEVASDAFETLRDLLVWHRDLTAELFTRKYDDVIGRYSGLLTSENFVTKRQSLKLLGELLVEHLKDGMVHYISDTQNLKIMMNLLRDTSKTIQYEAFHVFKVFVANPKKPQGVLDILSRNREKLLSYLENFHNDSDNDQFKSEKAIVLQQISELGSQF